MKLNMHSALAIALATMGAGGVHAQSQSLGALACAAGIHCNGSVTPDEARIVLDMQSQAEAEQAFIDASRDWPDDVWRCAATGNRCGNLTQNDAQAMIPLPGDALSGAEVVRSRKPANAPAQPPAKKEPAGAPPEASKPPPQRKPGGIEVEIAKPGPSEWDLEPNAKNSAADLQPLDGSWHFASGAAQTSGNCPPSISSAMARVAATPQSGTANFKQPFHPSQLISSPQVTWQRIGPSHWQGILTASQGKPLQGGWALRVVSPTRIEGETTVRISVPSACTIRTPYTFVRQ